MDVGGFASSLYLLGARLEALVGHVIGLKGIFGPPRDLVTRAVSRVCGATEALRPAEPVRLVLMSTVSVNRPGRLDERRGDLDRAVMWVLRGVLPPARDNQSAAAHT